RRPEPAEARAHRPGPRPRRATGPAPHRRPRLPPHVRPAGFEPAGGGARLPRPRRAVARAGADAQLAGQAGLPGGAGAGGRRCG
ncbi:hypothetical protein GAY28_36150, partial [Azospirillum brasilense]|nr:hypothetical protein [Azospirillum brasilense]